ncbi:hypothetical protein B0H19DRAFT_1162428 [Mycena capillaripes]|nr:hypothetical protein B0H19DRAFT_1162428 [Mycena capillaripes]
MHHRTRFPWRRATHDSHIALIKTTAANWCTWAHWRPVIPGYGAQRRVTRQR